MSFHEDTDSVDQGAGTGPRGFLAVVWQRKGLVILGVLLGLLGGALVYWQRSPVYQATAQILVIQKRSSPLPFKEGSVDPRAGYIEDYMSTHLVLLRSPLILKRAVEKKDLASLKTFENSGDPVAQILASFSVTRDTKEVLSGPNNILHLSFRGPVADECPKVLTAIIDSYQEFLDITYKNVSDQTLDLITKARDVLSNDLDKIKEKYLAFRRAASPLLRNKEGVQMQMDRLASLQKERSALLMRQTTLRDRIKYLEQAIADGKSPEVLLTIAQSGDEKTMGTDRAIEDKLLPLLIQEKQLMVTFGEDHPQMKSVRKAMAAVQDHHDKLAAIDARGREKDPLQRKLMILREQLADADLLQQSLMKIWDDLQNDTKDLSNYEMQEDTFRADMKRAELIYQGTVDRLQQINLVRDTGGFDARVLSQSANGDKVAPSSVQNIGFGTLLGLLAGIGLAFLADLSDKSFRNPDEVRRRLGLPVLGHVPYLKPDPDVVRRVDAGEVKVDPLLYTLFSPKSLEAEAYRAVRTSLYFSTQEGDHKVLQVTSPSKGDGKSLLVSNLAISMAQSGKKVLVIDADCRRPRQHKIFGLSNSSGLTSVISKKLNWKDDVHPTPVDGLWVMPSGPIPPNPAELLSAPGFKNLLDAVRPEFDFVIVDTAPLLAVTDPCVVAGLVDGLMLVLRLTRQGRSHAERARDILQSLGVKILGVVVNGVARQGGAGIYNFEHYDYAESYTESDESYEDSGYYYAEEEKPVASKG